MANSQTGALVDNGLISQLENDLDEMAAELVARQDELVTLFSLTQALRSQLTIQPSLTAALKQIHPLFGSELAFAFTTAQAGTAVQTQWPSAILNPKTFETFELWQDGTEQDVLISADTKTQLPLINNLLLTPIVVRDAVAGGIGVANRKSGPFTYPDRKLLRSVAAQIGAHIENILLHQEAIQQARMQSELDLAQIVQVGLLPKSAPKIKQLDVAGSTRPAREVGGDFFDFLPLEDDFAFAVGDVSGKGMSAALLMGMLRNTLRNALRFTSGKSAAGLMDTVNDALYDDFTDVKMLATGFIGRYQPKKRELTYANAGHSPVVWCPANGKAQLLQADGTALGVLPVCFCETQSLTLWPGDVMIIGTDGFVEARNSAGDLFGYEPFLKLIEQSAHLSAEKILETLFDAIADFSGETEQDDDQTAIVLKGID